MTRKHFELIAASFKETADFILSVTDERLAQAELIALDLAATVMADKFARENPRFDKQRFFDACDIDRRITR